MTGEFLSDLRARGFTGEVGLHIRDLDGQELFALNPGRVFPAASTIKVPLLVMALELAQRGELELTARIQMGAADRVPGAGVLHELQGGLALTWQDVLTLMIVVSDNTATNLVIERLGIGEVNSWLSVHGWADTRLIGKLQLPPGQRNEAQRRGERNHTTPREQTAILAALAGGALLNPPHTDLALDILGRQQYRDIIGRRVPRTDDGELRYRLCSKSGELSGVHHDVGVLFTPRPLIVALLSEGGTDMREHPDNWDVGLLADALWPLLAQAGELGGQGRAGGRLAP